MTAVEDGGAATSDAGVDAPAVDAPDFDYGSASWGRALIVFVGSAFVLAALVVYNLTQGEPDATIGEVIDSVFATEPGDGVIIEILVREVRLPRVIIAVMAGSALGIAGVTLQDSLRNPLADPYLLGIAQGAGVLVAINAIYPEIIPDVPITVLCLIGGGLAGALVLMLSRNARDPVRTVLAGAIASLLLGTISTSVILLAPQERAPGLFGYFRFVIGSLADVRWDDIGVVLPWFVIAMPIALLSSRIVNLLQLGDEMAAGLGLNPTRARLGLMVLSLVLVTPFVAVIGPIGFVALFAPHVSRSLIASTDARRLMPVAAIMGATLLLAADTAGRLVFFPLEVPAGVFTWVIVGPVALFIVGKLGKRA